MGPEKTDFGRRKIGQQLIAIQRARRLTHCLSPRASICARTRSNLQRQEKFGSQGPSVLEQISQTHGRPENWRAYASRNLGTSGQMMDTEFPAKMQRSRLLFVIQLQYYTRLCIPK